MNPVSFHPAGGTQPLRNVGRAAAGTPRTQGPGFKELFDKHLSEVNNLQEKADQAVRDLATDKAQNLQEVAVAVNEADLSFRLMMQMRNRLVEAYKEIMRMQV